MEQRALFANPLAKCGYFYHLFLPLKNFREIKNNTIIKAKDFYARLKWKKLISFLKYI
jgi:hypothetical protein